MVNPNRVQTDLSRPAFNQLSAYAHTQGVAVNAAAKAILENALLAFDEPAGSQVGAESELLKWVERITGEYRAADTWGDDITLEIFERIRHEMRPVYDAAIEGSKAERTRVNRSIGRLVRRTLGAETRYIGDKLQAVTLPRGSSALISSYTNLFRKRA